MNKLARTYWDEGPSLGVCIDWFGPYASYDQFKQEISNETKGAKLIYFAEDNEGLAQYIGMTERPDIRFKSHHKISSENEGAFWFGIISSQGKSGRRTKEGNTRKSASKDLDQAETALINWLWPEDNDDKVNKRPEQTICIANRFLQRAMK